MSLYHSDWNPRGVRKDYERCAIGNKDAQALFPGIASDGNVTDACAWFAEDGRLRILVADTDTGCRLTRRQTKQGFSIAIERRRTLAQSEDSV